MNAALNLSSFVGLRLIDENISNVWLKQLPRRPWKHAAAAQEREALLSALAVAFPFRWVWLSEWATDDAPRWQRLENDEGLYNSCEGLDQGGWVLLLFRSDREPLNQPLECSASNPSAAKQLLSTLSADAAVISLVDDDEWLIATSD